MVFERAPLGQDVQTEIVRRLNDDTRRIRMLEQRLDVIDSRIRGIEEKVIDEMEGLRNVFDKLAVDIHEISRELNELRSETLRINKILDKTVRKTELKEIESLLDLYSPVKSKFVTRDEVERILEEKLGSR